MNLSKHKTDNDQLKQQLKTEVTEKVCPSLNQFIFGFLLKQLVLYLLRDSSFFEKHVSFLLGKPAEGANGFEERNVINENHSAVRSNEQAGTKSVHQQIGYH